ncbi:DoxX family protein [Roseicella sp. DB1501]|uniref:DoxX family protein n=1 Tax=Roseicella sp. DB1501 TaxID=2730925 RepID=UPI001490BBBD|nr:DoxX family protein [Roseicella sp. DB1501]NOG69754.1 DoxX family protein [Roseicella sp. DB1501]
MWDMAVMAPRMRAVLRIVAALLFIEHGTQKLFGFPGPPMGGALPGTFSLLWFAAVLELVGGALLVIGLFTRQVAFVLAGQMAFAYWMAHAPRSFYPVLNGGDAAILYCFIFLYFVAAGPGAWAIDIARGAEPEPGPLPKDVASLRR